MYECFLHGIFNYICEFCYLLKFPVSNSKLSFCIPHNIRIKRNPELLDRLDTGRKTAGNIYRLLSKIAQLNVHIFFVSITFPTTKSTKNIYRISEGKKEKILDETF